MQELNRHGCKCTYMVIEKSHTLFLDRDGVINRKIEGGYVVRRDEFHFIPGVHEAMVMLGRLFEKIFVVTNQQGIGKNLMTEAQLHDIHDYMISEIQKAGGRIDRVYYSPYLEEEGHPTRKPSSGMALQAQEEFPEVVFEMSVMVGDSHTDMVFGKNLGMTTVFIGGEQDRMADYCFPDLLCFALYCNQLFFNR